MASAPEVHVVIVGGGFGGLTLARSLRRAPVRVTLVDRSNHHLFQPLLYQVATAGLSPGDIALPIRSVLRDHPRTTVLLGEVTTIDVRARRVTLADGASLSYDFLVVAAGARTHYFGHDDWAQDALGLKDVDDALAIRDRVLCAFEAAEREDDPVERQRLLTFVAIGGGPTGVEMAGAFGELSRYVLARDFRRIRAGDTRVILLEGGPRILGAFDPELSARGAAQLAELGVEVRTGTRVLGVDAQGVQLASGVLPAATVVWAAGIRASPLAAALGVPLDEGGRVLVEPDCSIPGHAEVFVIGDMARVGGIASTPLPGTAPVAMQQARYVTRQIERTLDGLDREPFEYADKGIMATIGRSRAIAHVGPFRMSGMTAWVAWLLIHIVFLIGFRNRFVVMFEWFWSYVTYKRGARLITGARPHPPR